MANTTQSQCLTNLTIEQCTALLQSGKLSVADFAAEMERRNGAAPVKPLRCKVSEKGAVSVYGLTRQWPTTLYAAQWERLLDFADEIRTFIAANRSNLASK